MVCILARMTHRHIDLVSNFICSKLYNMLAKQVYANSSWKHRIFPTELLTVYHIHHYPSKLHLRPFFSAKSEIVDRLIATDIVRFVSLNRWSFQSKHMNEGLSFNKISTILNILLGNSLPLWVYMLYSQCWSKHISSTRCRCDRQTHAISAVCVLCRYTINGSACRWISFIVPAHTRHNDFECEWRLNYNFVSVLNWFLLIANVYARDTHFFSGKSFSLIIQVNRLEFQLILFTWFVI